MAKKTLKVFISRIIVICISISAVILMLIIFFAPNLVLALNTLLTGYQISISQPATINHTALCGPGTCKTVAVISGNKVYFVPTKSCHEWDLFIANKPALININNCALPSNCGDTFSYGGETYHGVPIGTQCWLNRNLNIGTFTSAFPTDNGIIEKYCYDGVSSNCNTYGGLYMFYESTGGYNKTYEETEGLQGICPAGWHVPTATERDALEAFCGVVDENNYWQALRACIGPGGTTAFNAQDYGYATHPGSVYTSEGNGGSTYFGLSSGFAAGPLHQKILHFSNLNTYPMFVPDYDLDDMTNAHYIRCIKDS